MADDEEGADTSSVPRPYISDDVLVGEAGAESRRRRIICSGLLQDNY